MINSNNNDNNNVEMALTPPLTRGRPPDDYDDYYCYFITIQCVLLLKGAADARRAARPSAHRGTALRPDARSQSGINQLFIYLF